VGRLADLGRFLYRASLHSSSCGCRFFHFIRVPCPYPPRPVRKPHERTECPRRPTGYEGC
jgi:hypothetical protein